MASKEENSHSYESLYKQIKSYERIFKRWEARNDRIVKKYKDDSRYDRNPNARFNILWSNVQTIQPAIFARLPRPDVSRRFRDNDPIGRVASMMLERALEFEIEHYGDYKSAMNNAVLDRLLGGRGVAWVRYEPQFAKDELGEPDDGFQITEDADEAESPEGLENESEERIESETCPVDYVHWKEFGHSPTARTWEEVTCVWRKVYMSRMALVERFGEELGYKIPLDTKPQDDKNSYKMEEGGQEALVYEYWCKETGKVYWISMSLGKIIDERDDPLQLECFFPCPKPLYSTMTTDSLEPIPDFTIYQDQARELDTLSDRIEGLINALKVRGVYDASSSELQRLFSEGENNTLIPVDNWQAFAEKQGMRGAIDLVDISPFAQALAQCYSAMEQVKGQIYELMGIADIQRGQSDPNETLGAQIIKSNNASGRLKTQQHSVVDFATSLLTIKAQIICNHFTDETLVNISGAMQLSEADKQYIPQALALLRDEASKNFRIEVTSDSMIYQDEQQEKGDRIAFLSAVGAFLQTALPTAQSVPELTPMLLEMLKFGVTAFKAGKQLEGIIDQTADEMRTSYENSKGQPKPPPVEIQKLQMQQQGDQQKLQSTMQLEQAKMQMSMEIEKAKQEYQAQENQLKFQLEEHRNTMDREMEVKVQQMRMMTERNTQVMLAHINNGAKIEVARISSDDSDGAMAYANEQDMAQAMAHPMQPIADAIGSGNNQMAQAISALVQTLNEQHNRPKTVIRGQDGKIIGVTVQ